MFFTITYFLINIKCFWVWLDIYRETKIRIMKYLHWYEFNDEFKDDYFGENYLEHWVSLTDKEEYEDPDPDGFVIEDSNYFVVGEDEETGYWVIKSSGTTSEYNGLYVFDHFDENLYCDVYTNGTKFLYTNQYLGDLKPSDNVNPESYSFVRSVVYITPYDESTRTETDIKISSIHHETIIDEIKKVDYDKSDLQKALEKPLTITALESGTIVFNIRSEQHGG